MYRNILLNIEQISELRLEVNKILQSNMQNFEAKIAQQKNQKLTQDYESLYDFSRREYLQFQKTLQNLADFTLLIMGNFDQIWDQVHHRQSKLLELRESFSSVTSFMEDLRTENEDLKEKILEAEKYIQQIEQEKQEIDSIFYQCSPSRPTAFLRSGLAKCVSQRTLKSSDSRRKNVNYQKLKIYIENLRQQKIEVERELIFFVKKYESKCQQLAKANQIIVQLAQKLSRRNQIRQYLNSISSRHSETKTQMDEDILKIMQKCDNSATCLSKQTNQFFQQDLTVKQNIHYFDSFLNLRDSQPIKEQENNLSILGRKEFKDVKIGTDSYGKRAVACQTNSQGSDNRYEKEDLRISISILGADNSHKQQEQIVQIINKLEIGKKIQAKLRQPQAKKDDVSSDIKTAESKQSSLSKLRTAYQYYHKRLVASRIKKYHFARPDLPICARTRISN